ncbi:OB-fold nucleic acid binding domain-containing protein [Sulfolobus acidocaldarius]|uniref:Single strand DNA binding protein n=4 Tax=Sulfolobus acidocaldarius TaxID=2285 RepID=Q4JA43_SULAC|nr:OB-fold nucleic acid binding domain-containing protein [Sulfolobus acidocaldarius]AHC51311.1 single-stranded DNA-binding protein [Sulfolobus acidocaldarius SUSAZ]AAY80337.1 single strand DNA binding protein [Sulfolobus acidocaldarius DSM 639]AGE70918.1 single-stranded DNA-binding protein [Sulfolobus acidocaldarius N8]AGE73189.1 single-stranded DNA-binding protein [Sulfolobus acidocaldarius Ron12/I]ALU28775.1 single-stranded DNA-binding protein [Sulfolobus acidocaldarius]
MVDKVNSLKPGMENVNITVRVIEASEPRVIQTKNGTRTISEAVVGDETGRIKLTLWGNLAGTIKSGSVIKIANAWTTAYKGKVQLNAGSKSNVSEAEDNNIPEAESIPETTPSAGEYRGGGRGGRRFGGRRGGFRPRRESEGEEDE